MKNKNWYKKLYEDLINYLEKIRDFEGILLPTKRKIDNKNPDNYIICPNCKAKLFDNRGYRRVGGIKILHSAFCSECLEDVTHVGIK